MLAPTPPSFKVGRRDRGGPSPGSGWQGSTGEQTDHASLGAPREHSLSFGTSATWRPGDRFSDNRRCRPPACFLFHRHLSSSARSHASRQDPERPRNSMPRAPPCVRGGVPRPLPPESAPRICRRNLPPGICLPDLHHASSMLGQGSPPGIRGQTSSLPRLWVPFQATGACSNSSPSSR